MLKLLERTLVNRAYQLTRTLVFPARAETVESMSRTAAESVCGLDVNQSLSQPTKCIPLTVKPPSSRNCKQHRMGELDTHINHWLTSCKSAELASR